LQSRSRLKRLSCSGTNREEWKMNVVDLHEFSDLNQSRRVD
jgi:hypothetical protein